MLALAGRRLRRRHDQASRPARRRCRTPTPTPPPTPQIAVLVGAGDIADCGAPTAAPTAEATAKLLDKIAGDGLHHRRQRLLQRHARPISGIVIDPRWGRHKGRTLSEPGNHEYQSPGALPYFDYFGDRAGPRGAGFYSYTLGNWHVISLNSEVGVSQGQEQYVWLQERSRGEQARRAGGPDRCTLAYWHHPLFTSGPSAGTERAHARHLEPALRIRRRRRRSPATTISTSGSRRRTALGRRDAFGIQQFIVGTGGAPLYDFGAPIRNSLFRLKAYGVLKLTLRDVGYDSVFIEAGTGLQHDPTFGNLCH